MQNAPLTKHQLCWVIIRVAAVLTLASALANLITLIRAPLLTGESLPTKVVLNFIPTLLVKFAIGFYFLKYGNWLHKLLMKEAPRLKSSHTEEDTANTDPTTIPHSRTNAPKPEPVDPVTKLTEKETHLFENWLAANPENSSRDQLDQIALFRDYLRKLYE